MKAPPHPRNVIKARTWGAKVALVLCAACTTTPTSPVTPATRPHTQSQLVQETETARSAPLKTPDAFAQPNPTAAAQQLCAHYGPCVKAPPFPPEVEAFRECFGARAPDEPAETLTVVLTTERDVTSVPDYDPTEYYDPEDESLLALSPPISRTLERHVAGGVLDPADTADTILYGLSGHPLGDAFLFQIGFGIPSHGGRILPLVLDCRGNAFPIRGEILQTAPLSSGDTLVLSLDSPFQSKKTWNITSLFIIDKDTGNIKEHGALITRILQPLDLDVRVTSKLDEAQTLSAVIAHLLIRDEGSVEWEGEFSILKDGRLLPFEVPDPYAAALEKLHEEYHVENPLAR